jgi:hypothetical protein
MDSLDRETRITLRIPSAVYALLKEKAREDMRSINAEIVHVLQQALRRS